MKLEHRIAAASGPSRKDCHYLGYRYQADLGPEPAAMDSWVVRVRGERHSVELQVAGWISGLWRSPRGEVIAIQEQGQLYHRAEGATEWKVQELGASLSGVWGLDDSLVFVWGKNHDGTPFLAARYAPDTNVFEPMKSPGPIMAMHGFSRSVIFGVGERGFIVRFDGRNWQRLPSPTESALWSVAAVSEEEVYACGPKAQWLRGSILEWDIWFNHYAAGLCVAHANDRLWLGTDAGIFSVEDEEIVPVRDDLHPTSISKTAVPGSEVLFVTDHEVASTADGISFPRFGLRPFHELTQAEKLTWEPIEEEELVQDDLDNEWDPEADEEDEE